MKYVQERIKADRLLTYHVFEDHATGKNANNIFLIFESKQWSYHEFYECLQRVGNWLMNDLGIQKNEVVALNGGNTPEYIMLWLGLDAIGAVPSKINCNLTAQPLVHCVKLCECRYLLCDQDIEGFVRPCELELKALDIQTVYYSPSTVAAFPDNTPTPQSRRSKLDPLSARSLIYTSGTTGMPKATINWTSREINTARDVAKYLELKPNKSRMYTCMPLYHGAAHALCVTPSICAGSTVILGRKFSHKTFWPEVSLITLLICFAFGHGSPTSHTLKTPGLHSSAAGTEPKC